MSKQSAAAQKAANEIVGVIVGKVDPKLLRTALIAVDVPGPEVDKMSLGQQIEKLQGTYISRYKRAELLRCEQCKALSPETLDACPFCGADESSKDDVVEEEPPTGARAKVAEAPADRSAVAEVVHPAPSAALAIAPMQPFKALGNGDMTQEKLNELTEEIVRRKGDLASNYWDLGRRIGQVFKSEIWKVRERGNGKPAYQSFNSYAMAELKLPAKTCFDLMDAAEKFTQAQAAKLGVTKLTLVMRAPEKEQAALLQRAEDGATKRELREAVTEAKKKAGMQKRETGRAKTPVGKPGQQSKKPSARYSKPSAVSGRMTVAMVEGTQRIAMWAKPERKLKEGEKPSVAKRLADMPVGQWELENGVVVGLAIIQNPQGQIMVKVDVRRVEE